jgi:hypothetical protein
MTTFESGIHQNKEPVERRGPRRALCHSPKDSRVKATFRFGWDITFSSCLSSLSDLQRERSAKSS